MTATEFRDALKALGLSQRALAATLGVNPTTVWRWATEREPVPQYAVAYIELAERLAWIAPRGPHFRTSESADPPIPG